MKPLLITIVAFAVVSVFVPFRVEAAITSTPKQVEAHWNAPPPAGLLVGCANGFYYSYCCYVNTTGSQWGCLYVLNGNPTSLFDPYDSTVGSGNKNCPPNKTQLAAAAKATPEEKAADKTRLGSSPRAKAMKAAAREYARVLAELTTKPQ